MRAIALGLCALLAAAGGAGAASVAAPPAAKAAGARAKRRSARDYLDGVLLFQKGDYGGAHKRWMKALDEDPGNDDAKAGLDRLDQLQAGTEAPEPAAPAPSDGLRRVMDEAQSGAGLSPVAVRKLEAGLKTDPEDLAARHRLLGYYSQAQFSSDEARAAHDRQVLWLIQHHPEDLLHPGYGVIIKKMSPDAYEKGRVLWRALAAVHDADPAVLAHAAGYLSLDDPDSAETVLRRGETVEPRSPLWPGRLGALYALHAGSDAKKSGAALEQFEKAYALSEKEADRFYALDDLAKTAYAAGRDDKAEEYARRLLSWAPRYKEDWNYGNAVLLGNMTLGRAALRAGRKDEAAKYLLASGKTPGSPQLDSFGPNMSLAAELLAAGERKAVLEYFEECRAFWKNDGGLLDRWERAVKGGETPDFGANLAY